MHVGIVTPAPPRSRYGNRVTALRWARHLRAAGHRVDVVVELAGQPYDALVALHARRSHDAIARFRESSPEKSLIVALTGTDLYQDLDTSPEAHESLALADRVVLLQPEGLRRLSPEVQAQSRVIYQSVVLPRVAAEMATRLDRFSPT